MLDVCLLIKVIHRGHTGNTGDGIVNRAISLGRSRGLIPGREGDPVESTESFLRRDIEQVGG